jgi:Rieske Fe-S protein
MDRRRFLVTCGAATLAAACVRIPYVTGRVDGGRLLIARSEFAERSGVLVEHAGFTFPLYVRHVQGDEFTAVLTRCTHRGCTVEPEDDGLVCPCHGSAFAFDGALRKGPAEQPLTRFAVTADAETVAIALGGPA